MTAALSEIPSERSVPQGRIVFELLLCDIAARALKAPVIALGIGGSARFGLRADAEQDIDLIVVCDLRYRSRLRVAALGRILDIFQETPDSVAAELAVPNRAAFIRLLSGAHVLRDRNGMLLAGSERAQVLLAAPAPRAVFREEFELTESTRDLARRHRAATGFVRPLLRGALVEKVIDLAFARTNCWPAPLHRAIETLAARDQSLAARLALAVEGDDTMLNEIIEALVGRGSAVRRGRRRRIGSERVASETRPNGAVEGIRELHPPALARLSAETVKAIPVEDLGTMSRLQLMTIQRVHGSVLHEAQRRCIAAKLRR